ncbi:MAG: hypothetical protein ACFFD2_20820 [Promethearchaeota archaeon]
MDDIKKFIEELGITSFESNMKIASIAVVSDSGDLVYQTDNWDLTNQTDTILNVMKGERIFVLNNFSFSVIETTPEGIVGANDSGMGYVIFAPFQGGVLLSYVMAKADPIKALHFLKNYGIKLNGKL